MNLYHLDRLFVFQAVEIVVTQTELIRQDTLGRVRKVAKVLQEMDGIRKFDQELFGMLIERIKVINLVQVEFVPNNDKKCGKNAKKRLTAIIN